MNTLKIRLLVTLLLLKVGQSYFLNAGVNPINAGENMWQIVRRIGNTIDQIPNDNRADVRVTQSDFIAGVYTIGVPGHYILDPESSGYTGRIVVLAGVTGRVIINLNNQVLTSPTSSPAISLTDAYDVFILNGHIIADGAAPSIIDCTGVTQQVTIEDVSLYMETTAVSTDGLINCAQPPLAGVITLPRLIINNTIITCDGTVAGQERNAINVDVGSVSLTDIIINTPFDFLGSGYNRFGINTGIVLTSVSNSYLQNVLINGAHVGITISGTQNIELYDIELIGKGANATTGSVGIQFSGSQGILENIQVMDHAEGIILEEADQVIFNNVELRGLYQQVAEDFLGLRLTTDIRNISLKDIQIDGYTAGILMTEMDNVLIDGCQLGTFYGTGDVEGLVAMSLRTGRDVILKNVVWNSDDIFTTAEPYLGFLLAQTVENLTLEDSISSALKGQITLFACVNCFLNNVTVQNAQLNTIVSFTGTRNITVDGLYVHNLSSHDPSAITNQLVVFNSSQEVIAHNIIVKGGIHSSVAGALEGIVVSSSTNVLLEDCNVLNLAQQADESTLAGFVSRDSTNVNFKNCFVKNLSSIAITPPLDVVAFLMVDNPSLLLDTCTAQNIVITGTPTALGFSLENTVTADSSVNNCEATGVTGSGFVVSGTGGWVAKGNRSYENDDIGFEDTGVAPSTWVNNYARGNGTNYAITQTNNIAIYNAADGTATNSATTAAITPGVPYWMNLEV